MEHKTMALAEFIDRGYLQEVNRQFLHPLGLALALGRPEHPEDDPDGWTVSVWDAQDDPEGWIFSGPAAGDEEFERKAFEVNVERQARAVAPDAARGKRDAHLTALLAEVAPFAVVNETGVPATTIGGILRRIRGAK